MFPHITGADGNTHNAGYGIAIFGDQIRRAILRDLSKIIKRPFCRQDETMNYCEQ